MTATQCRTIGTPISSVYTARECADAGWEVDLVEASNRFAETCLTPYRRVAVNAAALQTRQVVDGDTGTECIMRMGNGFVAAANMKPCNDPGLFGEDTFPVKPPGFGNNGQLIVSRPAGSTQNVITFNGNGIPRLDEIATNPNPPTNPTSPSTNSATLPTIAPGGGSGTGGAIIGGGVLILVAANYIVAAYSGDDVGEFNFSPDYGLAASESGYSYNYGGRVEYQNASWNAYWTATQANTDGSTGDLRYGSGGSYKADFWTATFAESISGETADYDFAFSADVESGIWKLSPVYRMHSRFEEDGQSETDNALNLEGSLRYNRWTISPSAGFRWENAEDFGDEARFGLSVVRDL